MSLIQIILVLGTILGLWAYFSFFKSVTRNRLFLLFIGVLAFILILQPDLLTLAAQAIGVGRGVDLLFYLSLLVGFFSLLSLNGKMNMLERERTQLAREIALLRQKKDS